MFHVIYFHGVVVFFVQQKDELIRRGNQVNFEHYSTIGVL